MKISRLFIVFLVTLLLLSPLTLQSVTAAPEPPASFSEFINAMDTQSLFTLTEKIGGLFSGLWFAKDNDDVQTGKIRFVLVILLFAIFWALTAVLPFVDNSQKGVRIVIALALAILSVMGIPYQTLNAISATLGIVVSFLFIGGIAAGLLLTILAIPITSPGMVILRLIVIFILLMISKTALLLAVNGA